MFRKSKPFSDEYIKQHRESNRAEGILFLVVAFLMMGSGVFFDMTFTLGSILILIVLSVLSFHRRSQLVENEAIYKAIQARQKE